MSKNNQSHILLAIVATVFEFWECFDSEEAEKVFTSLYNDLCIEIYREEEAVYIWMKKYSYWDIVTAIEERDKYVKKYNL